MTAGEGTAIRAWLELIGETDPAIIGHVLNQCQRDADALDYFAGWAAAELPDDRRRCAHCANLAASGVCLVAREIGAGRDYRPVKDIPRHCEGYAPGPWDADKRTGMERWPSLAEPIPETPKPGREARTA